MAMQFYITLVPGDMSRFWRVNCDNDQVLASVVKGESVSIQHPFHPTVTPVESRWSLIAIALANTLPVIAWDFFVVNGTRQKLRARKSQSASPGIHRCDQAVDADTIVYRPTLSIYRSFIITFEVAFLFATSPSTRRTFVVRAVSSTIYVNCELPQKMGNGATNGIR
jgi:hypothetical protein